MAREEARTYGRSCHLGTHSAFTRPVRTSGLIPASGLIRTRNLIRTRGLILPLLTAAAFLLLAGCGGRRDTSVISTSGTVEMTEVRVSAKVGGRLASFPLAEGDRVEAGQRIASIDTVDLAWQRDAARSDAELAAAEMRLRLAGSRPDEIAEAQALLRRAEAEADAAQKDLERMEGLLREGSGTEKARDDARNRRDQALAAADAARQQLHRRKTGSRPEEIEAARARTASAEARAGLAEQQLADATVLSPLSGVITEKLAEPGELLSPGTPLCVIIDAVHPRLVVYVGEPDLARIRLGQDARVMTDSGEKRTGRITFIADKSEFTPKNVQTADERVKLVYKVKISLENPDGLWKSGMPAEADIPLQTAGSAGQTEGAGR